MDQAKENLEAYETIRAGIRCAPGNDDEIQALTLMLDLATGILHKNGLLSEFLNQPGVASIKEEALAWFDMCEEVESY